jgi:transposase
MGPQADALVMATHIHTPDELGDLLTTLLAGAAGGTKEAWATKVGLVEKLPIATNVQSNWRITPSGRVADKIAIGQAVDIVRAQHPCVPEGAPHGIELAGKKGDIGRLIGRAKGGMNTKLHALADANGRPLSFFMTAGQVSDYTGAAALLDDLPKAQWLLGDRGYDADWFRDALQAKGIQPCIPGRRSRNEPVRYDKRRYRRRSRIEIMFGRLKDWRRVATRYDRCPTVFFSAVALAATVIFWL